MKKAFAIILVLALCLSIAACSTDLEQLGQQLEDMGQVVGDAVDAVQNPDKEKTFTNAGVTLTLTTAFLDFTNTEKNSAEYDFFYANDTHGILAIREDKAELYTQFEQMTAEGYANLIASLYNTGSTAVNKDGFWTYTYESEDENGSKYTFLCVFYETQTAFWNMQCSCPSEQYAARQADMWSYLTSATFTEG